MDESMTPRTESTSGAQTMSFFDALKQIHVGKTVKRLSWGNEDYCLMKDGWLSIYTKGQIHSWLVNDGDMAGEDWVVVKELN